MIRIGTIFVHYQTELGDNVLIGNHCVIGLATIGDDVMLAHHVSILSGRYHHPARNINLELPKRMQTSDLERITIGKDVWIGANATVMADVGDYAIVGASAVVVKPVHTCGKVVGNPAKEIS